MRVMEEKQLKRLIDVRIDAGYRSQEALADEARVTRSTVWLAENGRPISYTSKRLIVNALKRKGIDIEVDDLDWLAQK